MKMVVEAVPNLVRRHALNKFLTRWGGEPWQVARTTILALAAVYAVTKLSGRVRRHGLKKTVLFLLLKVARTVPQLRRRLQQEQRKFGGDMREEIFAMLPRRDFAVFVFFAVHVVGVPRPGQSESVNLCPSAMAGLAALAVWPSAMLLRADLLREHNA
ncbi:MAG: hypothetical protein MHM6MM_002817 [Cercozoa sp. M6MM]